MTSRNRAPRRETCEVRGVPSSTNRLAALRYPRALALAVTVLSACATEEAATIDDAPRAPSLPSWIGLSLTPSPELDEASALLCARDTDNVIDHDVRRATGLADGTVAALVERASSEAAAKKNLAARALPLAREMSATHAGVVVGATPEGKPCAAVTLVKRLFVVDTPLPRRLEEPAPVTLAARGDVDVAVAYVLRPTGFVEKRVLVVDGGRVQDTFTTGPEPGRHVLEVVVDQGADDPEVALYWPFTVGTPKAYPMPAVLFPDEGHDDHALTMRLESMVLRLRNEQEIDPLMLSPALSDVAKARAGAISDQGALGHRRPEGRAIGEDLARRGDTAFARVVEVQAQGATLREAWRALIESPAHRHALLDTGMSTMGGAVVRGRDALDRPLLSVVVVVAKRMSSRAIPELKTELLGRVNLARHARGAPLLKKDPALEAVADAHAQGMARVGVLDERVDDDRPVSVVALEALDYQEVRALLAALDDPLRLVPSRATLAPELDRVGIGIAGGGPSGRFMVCILVGAGPPADE